MWPFRKASKPKLVRADLIVARTEEFLAQKTFTKVEADRVRSLVIGGLAAHNFAILAAPEYAALRQDNEHTMTAATRPFALAMLSRWAHSTWRESGSSANLAFALRQQSALINKLFDATRGDVLDEEYLLVTSQFDRDMADRADPAHRGVVNTECEIVLSLAARELGRPLSMPIEALGLPVDDGIVELLSKGWIPLIETPGSILNLSVVFDQATLHMFEFYRGL